MLVGQTTQRGCSIVPRRPRVTKALALSLIAFWIIVMAAAASSAIADEAPNRVRIEYAPPKSPKYQDLFSRLKANRALEKMQEMFSSFRLPNDILLRTTECGMANAWYQRPTVTICYEYMDDIEKGIRKDTHDGITPNDAALGQFIYVVAHEMGHALFDSLNVPLLGRPEDAADEFSTYMMLSFGKQEARRLIHGAAYGYKDYVRNPKVTVPLQAFSDAHGAPMQRFYKGTCRRGGARGCRIRIWRAQLRISAFDQTSRGSAARQGCSAGWLAAGCSCRTRPSAGASSN